MTKSLNKKVLPGHEPHIQGGSPSLDYRDGNHTSLSAKNAHTDFRLEGLKLAYAALTPRIFGTKQPLLDDIKELYELAQYNVRFILNEDIKLEYLSKDEKIRKTINQYK